MLEVEPKDVIANHMMKRVEAKFTKDVENERQTYQRIFTALEDPESKPLYEEVPKEAVSKPVVQDAAPSNVPALPPTPAASSTGGVPLAVYVSAALLVLFIAFLLTRS